MGGHRPALGRALRRAGAALALSGALAGSPGCVTETHPVSNADSAPRSPRPRPGTPAPTTDLPQGPLASPAAAATQTTRLRVGVVPLGTIPYDGQVLPLVSPDGRFLAVQEGEAPPWEVLLARPGAVASRRTRLAVYDITSAPIRRVDPGEPLPAGLVLGRAADHAGFLVEHPREDGSRWIGRAAWVSGRVEWLVQGADCNAHAMLTASGDLLFTRQRPGEPAVALICRTRDGVESAMGSPDIAYAMPMATADPAYVYALLRSERGLEVETVRLSDGEGGPVRLGAIWDSYRLDGSGEAALAYQVGASVSGPLPRSELTEGAAAWTRPPQPLILVHPRLGRLIALWPVDGSVQLLAPGSIAGVRDGRLIGDGFLCTTPEGLVFSRAGRGAGPAGVGEIDAPTRVLASAYVARATTDPLRPYVLLGPSGRDLSRLEVAMLTPGEPPG